MHGDQKQEQWFRQKQVHNQVDYKWLERKYSSVQNQTPPHDC